MSVTLHIWLKGTPAEDIIDVVITDMEFIDRPREAAIDKNELLSSVPFQVKSISNWPEGGRWPPLD